MGLKNLRRRKMGGIKKAPKSKVSKSNGLQAKKLVVNPMLKSIVKRIVKKEEEVKHFTNPIWYKQNIFGTGFNTTTGLGITTISSILPVIQQGVGQQQRIGNRIRPVAFVVRGHVVANPVTTTNNPYINVPFYVRICVWRQKQSMTTVSNTQFLDDGITNGGNDFDGTLDDLMVPFNKDRFDIPVVRQFMLQPCNSQVGLTPETLSKFPVSRMFKFRVPLPKSLIYNDTAQDPSNCKWYMSAGIVNADGTLATTSVARAAITSVAVLKYTDA